MSGAKFGASLREYDRRRNLPPIALADYVLGNNRLRRVHEFPSLWFSISC
jgi:hypothetical protein